VTAELIALLQECYRDKLTELLRHEAGARLVAPYEVNNAYQYLINREETQLTWLARAIAELGGTVDTSVPAPDRTAAGARLTRWRTVAEEDVAGATAFVDKWAPRADALTHARHRKLLRVILGETLEQRRTFEQALAGHADLLGRREEEVGPVIGEVLAARWTE
jgi:hypothetical protein